MLSVVRNDNLDNAYYKPVLFLFSPPGSLLVLNLYRFVYRKIFYIGKGYTVMGKCQKQSGKPRT